MFGKKVFAAMLATVLGASLFGANAAKAQIVLTKAGGQSTAAITYATETLATPVTGFADYSVVKGDNNELNVTAEIGLGGPSGTYATIRFELNGMVFSMPVTGGDLQIDQHATPSIRAGGGVGDDYVSFIANRQNNPSATETVTLTIAQLGVKPAVHGSVTMTVTDTLGPEMYTASYLNAVRTARALDEAATPMDLEATVEARFKMFSTPTGTATMGTLGSFMVGMVTPTLKNAVTGADVELDNIIADATSTVTISGDFSFVSAAWLDEMATCTDTANLLKMEDGEVSDTKELMAVMPSEVVMKPNLCISVLEGDGAVAIPETAPYMVTTVYAPGTPMAGWPPNGGEYSLGRITRDGTTVHIPFLTTWADYNQRIVISNRGASPADYWITFRPEEGVTATPNDMYATGTLDGESTIVLKAADLVTLEGRTRTAATFVAEAQTTQIDVATVIINLMTGSTDTVNYDAE